MNMFHSYNLGIPPTTYVTHYKDKSTLVSPDKYNNHTSTKSDKQIFFPFDKKDKISYKSFYK